MALCYKLLQLLVCSAAALSAAMMDVKYKWSYVDYAFESPQHRESALKFGHFIPENCVILDVDVFEESSNTQPGTNTKTRVFVTVPRIKPGNPASIAELVPGDKPGTTLLAPYPNWKANYVVEDKLICNETIVSVFRTKIDSLGRFWVVDVGTLDQFGAEARSVCPPKILIFNLKNKDKVIKMYTFPSSQIKDQSLLTNIEVDIKDPKGLNTFAYISDTTSYKLVVYDFKNDDSWVIDQAYFYPYPNKAHFDVNGVSFDLMDGILGMALEPLKNPNRKLYFHSFASSRESWVDTNILRNKSLFEHGLIDGTDKFFVTPEVRKTQSSVEVITDSGILIYASMDSSLFCWNVRVPFTAKNTYLIYKNADDFQFPTGMKIVGDKLWAVACQLQNQFTTVSQDPKSIKCRVLVGQLDKLINDTGCKMT